jgi:hypothetical protein
MQQGRNAAESALIRLKQAAARKPARNGEGLQGNRAAGALLAAPWPVPPD